MGKSEMECPGELWVETPGQPGRPDERKLSMLSTLRTFLHGFLYRPQELFASLGSLIDVLHPLHAGPSRAKSASRSLRRALLMPQVNTGSLYRCGKRT